MLVWCEVDQERLTHNICMLRAHVGSDVLIAPVVKSNGYGHGILIAAHAFLAGGAHWLCVNSLEEAQVLRAGGVICPIYLLGPVDVENVEVVISLRLRLVIYTQELIQRLIKLTPSTSGEQIRLHLKVETGNHRQGVPLSEALTLAQLIHQAPHLYLEGVCSHFANIEDTTDHNYAHLQMERFLLISQSISAITPHPLMRHISNSAATLLWPEHTMELVRVGIGAYGLWPSRETLSVAKYLQTPLIDLRPALCWKVKVVQLKEVPEGSNIG